MQAAIKNTIAQRPGPSPAAFSTLMRRIEQEKQTQSQKNTQPITSSWWKTVESAFRSLFEIQWVPALASVLIVGQAFLLFSLIGRPEGQQGQGSVTIIERGIPQGTPATPSLKIEVQFVETAQERPIRGLVRDLGGRIIDGPTEDGRYTLGFPISPGLSSDSILTMLGKHPELVQKAQLLGP